MALILLPFAIEEMCLLVSGGTADICFMKKWQSEEEMNAELRRIAREMRQIKEELRGDMPGHTRTPKLPALPTEDERRLRPVEADDRPRRKR
jgi:hypothetical protein